ncbi:MAG: hypothetical protein EPO23_12755 [Xanthobacteraceae bacterium]|nr:MAG: hypothetical protein EPO23_12755 [Xanthobacteraceae bacterium]
MTLKNIVAMALLAAMTSFASAHAPKVGANGGAQADAGSFHVEVVPQGTTLQVFLRSHADKVVLTEGYKGTAIFIVDGNPQRIPLTPAGENKLTGTSEVSIPSEPKGAVQITTPTGSTMQAKFD